MVDFILIVMVIGLAVYSFETRKKLMNLANFIDQANSVLAQEIVKTQEKRKK